MGLWAVFVTVLLAELGDKTQLATLLFASNPESSKVGVFVAASAALVLSTLVAVVIGGRVAAYVSPRYMKVAAGIGLAAIGVWLVVDAWRGA